MAMSKRKLKALQGSIRKWEKIVDGTGVDRGNANCPLCKLYSPNKCKSCPVRQKVGVTCCEKTPWRTWAMHQFDKHSLLFAPFKVKCPTCKELAQAELDFLQSLLPE